MYIPKLYRNENTEEIIEFISKNNFGVMVSENSNAKIIATHIPFTVSRRDERLILSSHISKANEQWKNFSGLKEVLLIFTGAHSYISSSWYDHVNVPTWNYIAAHLYGTVHIMDEDATYRHLEELVALHERQEKNPVSVHGMGKDYVRKEMQGLVAFEIEINEMYSAFKLSQNRDEKNIKNIIAELQLRGDENSLAIADAIIKQRENQE